MSVLIIGGAALVAYYLNKPGKASRLTRQSPAIPMAATPTFVFGDSMVEKPRMDARTMEAVASSNRGQLMSLGPNPTAPFEYDTIAKQRSQTISALSGQPLQNYHAGIEPFFGATRKQLSSSTDTRPILERMGAVEPSSHVPSREADQLVDPATWASDPKINYLPTTNLRDRLLKDMASQNREGRKIVPLSRQAPITNNELLDVANRRGIEGGTRTAGNPLMTYENPAPSIGQVASERALPSQRIVNRRGLTEIQGRLSTPVSLLPSTMVRAPGPRIKDALLPIERPNRDVPHNSNIQVSDIPRRLQSVQNAANDTVERRQLTEVQNEPTRSEVTTGMSASLPSTAVMRAHDNRDAIEGHQRAAAPHFGANFPGLSSDIELDPTNQEQMMVDGVPRLGNPSMGVGLPGLDGDDTRGMMDRTVTSERFGNAFVEGVPERRDMKVRLKKTNIQTTRTENPYLPGNKRPKFQTLMKKESDNLHISQLNHATINPILKSRPSINNRPRLPKPLENREVLNTRVMVPTTIDPLSRNQRFVPLRE